MTKPIQINDVSPWGLIDTATYLADGITVVSTLSHGGIHLSPERLNKVPMEWRMLRRAPRNSLQNPWFEEDCEACLVVLTYLSLFTSSEHRDYAAAMQEHWLNDKMETFVAPHKQVQA